MLNTADNCRKCLQMCSFINSSSLVEKVPPMISYGKKYFSHSCNANKMLLFYITSMTILKQVFVEKLQDIQFLTELTQLR